MQSRDFAYWLQGFFEVASMSATEGQKPEVAGLNAAQVSMIRNHLNLVFKHEIDPAMGNKEHQSILNATHSPGFDPTKTLLRC